MVKFKIKPFNGKTISKPFGLHSHVKYFAVFALNVLADEWIFIKSFYSELRAQNFIDEIKNQIAKGDYSCLTLKG